MTPKEKSDEIFKRHYEVVHVFMAWNENKAVEIYDAAKQCALIAVMEMLPYLSNAVYHMNEDKLSDLEYWQQVKEQIEKM